MIGEGPHRAGPPSQRDGEAVGTGGSVRVKACVVKGRRVSDGAGEVGRAASSRGKDVACSLGAVGPGEVWWRIRAVWVERVRRRREWKQETETVTALPSKARWSDFGREVGCTTRHS